MRPSPAPDYRLTIAIPTFNRAQYLRRCLESVIDAAGGLLVEIELLISDNGSTDETPEVIEEVCEAGILIRYHHYEENRGPDWNILNCYTLAQGQYVWIVGDDDVLLQGSIGAVLALIRRQESGIIHVGVKPFRSESELEFQADRTASVDVLLVDDPYEYIQLVNFPVVFITSSIVNKAAVPVEEWGRFIGTNLVQLAWLLPAMTAGFPNAYIQNYLVGGRIDNTGGYGLCTVFGRNLNAVLTDLWGEPALIPLANVLRHRAIVTFFPDHLLRARILSDRFDAEDGLAILLDVYSNSIWFWLCTAPSLLLPISLARFYYTLTHLLVRSLRGMKRILSQRKPAADVSHYRTLKIPM